MASNIQSFISSNGRAPNYASSSLGNIRYESLVYMYSKIIAYYHTNGQLPSSVVVSNVVGVDSAGVVIDNLPPSVSNNLAPGFYNNPKNVTLTASDNRDTNPRVYYSLNNGTTWSNQIKTVTLSLNQGVTNLRYYAHDASGNTGQTQSATYTIDTTLPQIDLEELEYAAGSVQSYLENEHQLPGNLTLSGSTVTMAQFLKLTATAIISLNNNINTTITLESYEAALNPSETITTSGNLTKTDYINLANSVKSYMDTNRQAPNYQTISLGNMRYESLVYTFAQILKSYQVAQVLPNFITVRPWSLVTSNSTTFITMDQVNNAADTVQSYIESNHQLPGHVTMAGSTVTMPQFLKLETTYLMNAKENLYQSIPLGTYGTAPNPSESITGGDLNRTDYLNTAGEIITFMDANGRVPNYKPTVRGYIRYESLVYIYSEIINSASRNKRLPDYITLTPWTTVTNPSTVFITMDQINTAVWTVKSNVETNHALPSSVTITGRPISMSQFLKLEITSLKNIYAGLYQSMVLKSYGEATSPSETLTSGKINQENYLNAANTIKSFMDTNGRAPNYSWTSQGNMRYEDLVYMYSQILNYYNVKDALPQYITVNPWSVVSNPGTVTFNAGQIISGAETVTTYVEANHTLPGNVNISGTTVSMPQFLKLLTTTLHNINGTYTGQLVLGSYGLPTDTPESITGGSLNQSQYLDLARDTEFFMYGDLRAPNYRSTTTLGNICYQSLIYMYSQILSSYKSNSYTLPDFITVRPWSVVSNVNTKFSTTEEISNATKTVKSYVETNHTLPSSVNLSGTTVTMPQFLKLISTAVSNINGKLEVKMALQSYSAATSPSETVTGGSFNGTGYLNLANSVINYMDSNGRAPDYSSTSLGNLRYESLVYLNSLILDYYHEKDRLPQSVTVTPWSVVTNTSTKFFTTGEVEDAAKNVQSHIETNHALPSSVNLSGTTVTMPQFLQLASAALLNVDDSLYTSLVLRSYNSASSPSETITQAGNLTSTDYVNLSHDILSYMYANGRAPDYRTISLGNMRYESLVYLYSQILSSHNATGALPESVTVHPWTVVANTSTVFVTTSQIKTAAETVKSYVETNHTLPSSVTISGTTVTIPQFLKLAVKAVLNVESYLYTSVILSEVEGPGGSAENMTSGTILSDEFVAQGKNILTYINSKGSAPQYVNETSLGGSVGYESLVYLYSLIMSTYNATAPAPDQVYLVPWLAQSNPNGTFNFRTQEIFSTIQAALDDADTVSGDTIWLRQTIYTENVIINKKITIRPVYGTDVTVEASNPNLPIFTINTTGNGTTIRDLLIRGATGSAAIYLNNSLGNYLLGNNLTGNANGVYLFNSTENVISGNNILNNTLNGVLIDTGSDNEISSNTVKNNGAAGIRIRDSDENRVYSNILTNNQDGIHLYNSSTTVHFNSITGNSRYGLYNEGNGTVNATNNWWGSNNPLVSSTSPSDIYLAGGSVTYNPWLVLSLDSSADRSNRTGTCYDYLITADLTRNNQGNDTSSDGNVPDEIPLYFNSTLGTINSSGSTRKGRSELKLTSTTAGAANVSVTLDNQTINRTVNITSVAVLGVYNTRSQESFASIQEAVDDPDTINGDTITLAHGTYTENVALNKKLTIKPVTGDRVTVKAKDDDKSVILVVNAGSGTTIQGINVIGASISYGISLSHAYNCVISDNVLSNSSRDIYLYLSGNNEITGNTIKNSINGISLYNSISNNISHNIITKNENGIYAVISNYNSITGNTLNSNYYGSYLYHSSNVDVIGNNITGNWVGVYLYDTNNNQITGNNLKDNGAGITYHNSIGVNLSGNSFTDNWLTDTSVIDSGEVIMATTIYSCGPAALATILKKLGIYTTEVELAKIAKTDETGTSLLGLKDAANAKGINAFGYELSLAQLKPDYIVVLKINGYNHFEAIQNITNTTITLFDPNLGIIQMNLTTFNDLYTGYAFVLNETIPGAAQLTDEQMRNIKGLWHTVRKIKWRWHPGEWKTYTKVIDRSIPYPTIKWSYHRGWTIWTPWGPREIGGYWYPSGITIKYHHIHYKIRIRYYVPGYPEMYAAYVREADTWDIDRQKYYSTLFTVAGVGGLIGGGAKAVTLLRAGKSISTAISAEGILGSLATGNALFGDLNYINPDPNPSGKGEGVINMIDPSWEPFLSN